MKSKHLIIASIILFGSLWGLAELGIGEIALANGVPRAAILTAAGVFFLLLTRRLWAQPGSSLALSAVAASFKFLQHPVWGCKIAAVLMVGAIFDIGLSLMEARSRQTADAGVTERGTLMASPVMTFISFVLFAYFARDVLHNPYWSAPDKMTDYMFIQGPIAAALSLPAALAGVALARSLERASKVWTRANVAAYRLAAVGSGMAATAAAIAMRY